MNAPARIRRGKGGQFIGSLSKPEAKRGREEAESQKAVVDWCRFCLRDDVLFLSIPNERGAKPTPEHLAMLAAMGLYSGAADLLFVWPGGVAFIEMKAKDGTVAVEQKAFAEHAARAGAKHAVCRSRDAAIAQIKAWGIPHREVAR